MSAQDKMFMGVLSMNNGNKGINILLKALSVIIAAAALITAIWWWQMPYMHNLYADEYLNIGVHIFVFLCCAALCVFTFIFAGKNNGLLRIMGIALFVFSVCTFLVNSGFVPPILHIILRCGICHGIDIGHLLP